MIGALAVRPGSQECTCHWPALCDGTGWKQCQDDCDCRCGGICECAGCNACSLKLYYQHTGITIYRGDCREILPQLRPMDLVLTDPPYGINAARNRNSQKWGWTDFEVNGWDAERAPVDLIRLVVAASRHAIVWGGNYFTDTLPPTDKWLIWDKGQEDFSLADVEMAWCSWKGAARRILLPRSVAFKDGKQHPTQKPIAVMVWAINHAPKDCRIILDPFMGSGTTLVAAKRLGRKAIGIEIEEKYCEIAAQRLEAERLTLFEYAGIVVPTQLKLEGVA